MTSDLAKKTASGVSPVHHNTLVCHIRRKCIAWSSCTIAFIFRSSL